MDQWISGNYTINRALERPSGQAAFALIGSVDICTFLYQPFGNFKSATGSLRATWPVRTSVGELTIAKLLRRTAGWNPGRKYLGPKKVEAVKHFDTLNQKEIKKWQDKHLTQQQQQKHTKTLKKNRKHNISPHLASYPPLVHSVQAAVDAQVGGRHQLFGFLPKQRDKQFQDDVYWRMIKWNMIYILYVI